jgi:hypothetical protein
MDTIIFSRIAMAGWIFLAVLVGSIWSTNSAAWQGLLALLQNKDSSSLALGVAGVIVGIGAPPALGFLLERAVTLLLIWLKRSPTVYPKVVNFKDRLPASFKAACANATGPAAFHITFYNSADKELQNWARRRLAQVYASAIGAAAIVFGLVVGRYVAGSFNFAFVLIALAFAALLVNDARVQSNAHRDTIGVWVEAYPCLDNLSRNQDGRDESQEPS